MASVQRKQAPRLARPAARYWKGKAPKGIAEIQSDSDVEEEGLQEGNDEGVEELEGQDEETENFGLRKEGDLLRPKGMNITLKDVSVSKEGKVIIAGREEIEDLEESEEESEEDEKPKVGIAAEEVDGSSEDESESESEEERVEFRPVFVPKRVRATIAERAALTQDSEEALIKKEKQAEERRKESHDLVAQTIRRELAEKEKEADINDVDDTDDLDPTAEFEAWRLRELERIKKEKEAELAREMEREEVERRRAMPEEQRMKEDLEHANKLREEKPKGQQKFLQKYWHKGAFHQGDEILNRRDYTEATESTVDVSLLPSVMQVKDFGKRSRTKYTHLVDQDTTIGVGGFGGHALVKAGGTNTQGGGCFLCGGPHLKKDCPQNNESGRPTGANAVRVQNQRYEAAKDNRDPDNLSRRDRERSMSHWKESDRPRSEDDHRDRRRMYGARDKGDSHSRPSRNEDAYRERRRSRERSVERETGDKRRRLD